MSFQRKVFLSFAAVIIVPTLAILALALNLYLKGYADNILRYARIVCEVSVRATDIKLRNYRQMTMQIYYNRDLFRAVEHLSLGEIDGPDTSRIQEYLNGCVNSDRHLASAYVQAGAMFLNAGQPLQDFARFFSSGGAVLVEDDATLSWLPTEQVRGVFGDSVSVFGVARRIRNNERQVGSLLLLVKEDFFQDIFNSMDLGGAVGAFFAEDSGRIISGNSILKAGAHFAEIDRVTGSDAGGRSADLSCLIDSKPHLLVFSRCTEADWIFILLIPREAVRKGVAATRNVVLLVVGLFLLFLAILSYLFSRGLARPIRRLIERIEQIGEGDLRFPPDHYRGNEIGRIGTSIGAMVERIRTLIDRVKEEEQLKKAAELKSLQIQLSPHFLYNTLNTIRWMAVINKQDNIKQMITALIALMRDAAATSTFIVALGEELRLLQSYVQIQRMRFSNFELKISVGENFLEYRIIKFALQSIVENSIVHGFRGLEDGGVVEISACEKEGVLQVAVADNGSGFDLTVLDRPQVHNDEEHVHTGLAALRERIRLYYGEQFGLEVQSRPQEGTRVVLRLPIVRNGDGRSDQNRGR